MRIKQRLVNTVKYSKKIYTGYYYLASIVINVVKLFVKPDDKLILFNSFAGRKYDDSPKELFEYMLRDERFKEYKFVWAFHEPDKYEVKGAKKIKTDTFAYFTTTLKARAWITNSSVERGLDYKGKKTFYLNTWHGSPIKKMGSDIAADNSSFSSKSKNKVDVMNTQSNFEADIFSKAFGIPRTDFIEVGLPRNDKLAHYTEEQKNQLKKKIGLPLDKKVILYAPTFREYERDENNGCVLVPPIDLQFWRENLEEKYCLLFRAHYEVASIMNIGENDFVKNMTKYPVLNDLMIVSDVLISDYSSIFFDYSVMDKCMFHFTYDYDKYSEKRGMYFDIREWLSGGKNERELLHVLSKMDDSIEKQKTIEFRRKYVNFYGEATKKTVDCIAEHICN